MDFLPDKAFSSSFSSLSLSSAPSCPQETSDLKARSAWGLDKDTKRELILDIDQHGGLLVVDLEALCNKKPDLYGTPNSSLRRQVQNKVGKWKKLSAPSFDREKRRLFAGQSASKPLWSVPVKPTKPVQPSTAKQPFPFRSVR